METICQNGNTVEYWMDRSARYWVIQVKDPEGNQIGDADFSGTKSGVYSIYKTRIQENGGKKRIFLDSKKN